MEFCSFPSIGGLHNVVETFNIRPDLFEPQMVYRGKVKLHGINVGVRITANGPIAQGRTIDLSETDRGMGFYNFVNENEEYFRSLWKGDDFVLFGEWCGPGVQSGTAVSQIREKVFAIFMVQNGVSGDPDTICIYDPAEIEKYIEPRSRIYVLPWYGEPLTMIWGDRPAMQALADAASDAVQIVEDCDPWVEANFGIQGIGEGIVYYPETIVRRDWIGTHIFKAKGRKHKVHRTREIVQLDPEVASSIDDFVSMFVTEPRLEQGLAAVGGTADKRVLGDFIVWMNKDIEKESGAELAASGLIFKQVSKPCMIAAREWFFEKGKSL